MTDRPTLPEGMHQLSPHLVCRDASAAIDFYVEAFGATELLRLPGPDGKLMHGSVVINDSSVLLVDENLEWGLRSPLDFGGTPVMIHLVVPDADATFATAVAAGARPHMPVAEQFWGDRYGVLEDPFGHLWAVATPATTPKTMDELAEAARNAGPS